MRSWAEISMRAAPVHDATELGVVRSSWRRVQKCPKAPLAELAGVAIDMAAESTNGTLTTTLEADTQQQSENTDFRIEKATNILVDALNIKVANPRHQEILNNVEEYLRGILKKYIYTAYI